MIIVTLKKLCTSRVRHASMVERRKTAGLRQIPLGRSIGGAPEPGILPPAIGNPPFRWAGRSARWHKSSPASIVFPSSSRAAPNSCQTRGHYSKTRPTLHAGASTGSPVAHGCDAAKIRPLGPRCSPVLTTQEQGDRHQPRDTLCAPSFDIVRRAVGSPGSKMRASLV